MKNSKSETLNPKQYQMFKIQNPKRFWLFEHLGFGFVSNLGFRVSDFHRKREGFTLIELIIYLAIVSIILISISYLIIDIMAGQTRNYAKQEVTHNLRFITNNLVKDIKKAQNFNIPASDTLVLTMPGDDITYNFDSVDKKITRQLGIATPIDLNTNRVEIAGSFSDLSYLSRAKSVGVYLEISYKNPGNLPDYNASTTADFSVELRGRR